MPATAKKLQKKKILIAEDEKPLAKALQLKLQGLGHVVTAVGNGNEALNELAKGQFDLLILDLMMPIKDGFAVLEEMKASGSPVPVIIASNLNQAEDIDRAKALGAQDYFTKSNTSIADIVDRINNILLK